MEGHLFGKKGVIPFLLGTVLWKRLVAVLAGPVLCLFLAQPSGAGLFGPSLPKGNEVEDPYLVQLFVPEFPYESIKVIETREGKVYVVIKAKEAIDGRAQYEYCYEMLPRRNIVLYRAGSEWTKTVLVAELTMYRFPSERPYVVEYSCIRGQPKSDKPWAPVEGLIEFEGKHIIVQVDKEFGRVFKRFVLYPEEDGGCPDPPFVGRYPNSKNLACFEQEGRIVFVYVTPDSKEAVFEYYKPLLRAHYESVGFCYPEENWGRYALYGLILRDVRFPEFADLLDRSSRKGLKSMVVPADSMILEIRADSIIGSPGMKALCVVTIRVSVDTIAIGSLIESSKRYCKDPVR